MHSLVWKLLPIFLTIGIGGCQNSPSDYDILATLNIRCPDGSQLEYRPWGKSGQEAVCLIRNGPIVMAEYGHIIIKGQYLMGKKVGEWHWFNASGEVIRAEHYDGTKP